MALRWGGGGSGGGGGGGQGNIQWQDDGTNTGSPGQATTVNVTGGATVSVEGSTATINVEGGGGPTLIETNTTLTVGTGGTYATFAAALAYLQSVVIADGVTITLQFVGTTSTEQITLSSWKSGIVITNTGSVAVTPTSWSNVSPALPFPAMVVVNGCSNVTITGTWAAEGVALLASTSESDLTINATLSGEWIAAWYQNSGETNVPGGTYGTLFAEEVALSGSINISDATITGTITNSGANIYIQNSTITGSITTAGGVMTLTGNTISAASGPAMLYTLSNGAIYSSTNSYTFTGGSVTYIEANGGGTLQSYKDTFVLGTGFSLVKAQNSGHVQISQVNTSGTGPATARYTAISGGLIQADGSASTSNWGADSIDPTGLLVGD